MNKYYIGLLVLAGACQGSQTSDVEKWKSEIVETEKAFAAMAKEQGIPEAFVAFAADDAVILRNNTLFKGKAGIGSSFSQATADKRELTWAPDFVDVSAAGDLGYTYGKYSVSVTDSLGNKTVNEGIFHTVWKRQPDGTWKFVWD